MTTKMQDISTVRQANFQRLFKDFKDWYWKQWPDEPEHGMLKLFAEKIGVSEAYASHLNCARKHIGDKLARQIEKAMGADQNWMDFPHSAINRSESKSEKILSMIKELYEESAEDGKELIIKIIQTQLDAGNEAANSK